MGNQASKAAENLGIFFGKSAMLGVNLGRTIAGGLIGAGVGAAAGAPVAGIGAIPGSVIGGIAGALPTLPSLALSAFSWGTTVYDMISQRDLAGDWNKTSMDLLDDSGATITDGIKEIFSTIGSSPEMIQGAERQAQRASDVINRELPRTPAGEIAKISAPIKMIDRHNTPIGQSARIGEKFVNIIDGKNALTKN